MAVENIGAPDFFAETLSVAARNLLNGAMEDGPEQRNSINSGIHIPLLAGVRHPMSVINS